MPQQLTYPGVYIEEIPSGVRTITGVSTSITAFVGRALRGPSNEAVRIKNFGDFERVFGGLWTKSTMSYAVRQYFMNGGSDALIVRIYKTSGSASTEDFAEIALPITDVDPVTVGDQGGTLTLQAASEGAWANNLQVTVDYDVANPADTKSFNLTVREVVNGVVVNQEVYYNVSVDDTSAKYVKKVLENQSALVRVKGTVAAVRPDETVTPVAPSGTKVSDDGAVPTETEYTGSEGSKTGMYSLEKADLFNILCVPPISSGVDFTGTFWGAATAYCEKRRAIVIVNPPSTWTTKDAAVAGVDSVGTRDDNAVLYFPNVRMPDPLRGNMVEEYVPCGVVAGVIARTDATRGVWKAPAGIDASLVGVQSLSVKMTDAENGDLNPLGVNCLRTLPAAGNVVWGARTLRGADRLASEWKYLPVRRLALFLEESLYRGTQWAVFEPNDEPLWAQIRMNVGAFMHQLYRQGAFQGRSPRDAYFVKCDSETTTQNDINQGIVNVLVGFAPLKPAEFVVLKIQQIAGKIES